MDSCLLALLEWHFMNRGMTSICRDAANKSKKKKAKRKKWQWNRIESGSRISFSLVSVVKLLDDPLADDLLMPIPKSTNSGAMLTTKKSLTNLLSAQSARWRRWIHDWLDQWTGPLGQPLLVEAETDYNRFGGRCAAAAAATAFAFYWTRSLVISSGQRIDLTAARFGLARQLLYLDKQLVTFNGIHCASGYACVSQRNSSHCSAALSPNCILHIQLYVCIYKSAYLFVCFASNAINTVALLPLGLILISSVRRTVGLLPPFCVLTSASYCTHRKTLWELQARRKFVNIQALPSSCPHRCRCRRRRCRWLRSINCAKQI